MPVQTSVLADNNNSTKKLRVKQSFFDSRCFKYIRVIYHTSLSCTYLFSIVWQVSRSKPIYNSLKYLTFQNQLIQLGTYAVCLYSNYNPAANPTRDHLMTVLSYPVSTLVFAVFWPVFAIDRELILPIEQEKSGHFPVWLNHICHTIILPANILEFFLVKHEHPEDKQAFKTLGVYALQYTTVVLIHRYSTGKFVYGFLDGMPIGLTFCFILASLGATAVIYKSGIIVNRFMTYLRQRCFKWNEDEVEVELSASSLSSF